MVIREPNFTMHSVDGLPDMDLSFNLFIDQVTKVHVEVMQAPSLTMPGHTLS